jgi:hypothetical protein
MKLQTVTGPNTLVIDSCYAVKAQGCDFVDASCAFWGIRGILSFRETLDICYDLRRPWFVGTDLALGLASPISN